jgi:predicted neuraminidase
MNGIFEQDPHSLPDGRIIGAAHFQPGTIASPVYTDNSSGIKGWIRANFTNLPGSGNSSRGIEPSWFWQDDGTIVMTFRDQKSTFCRLASVSTNRGQDWSTPVVTEMPDSRSKQSAGNLPDGTAFMVGNPVKNKNRFPLVITLSHDGKMFDKAFALRQGGCDLQNKRYNGRGKTPGYNYPKSMVWQGYLYVSYTTNKEDVEYTRVPLSSLVFK